MFQPIRFSSKQRRKFSFLLLSFLILTIILITTALIVQALPVLTATKTDVLIVDNNNNGKADPGDTLRYTVIMTNSGTMDAVNVDFADTIDSNTTLVAGSVKTTPIARNDIYSAIGNVGISVPTASGALLNDNDPDGGSVSVLPAAGGTASGGAFSILSNGSFSYLPPVGFEGTDSFSYTVQDSDGNQDQATVFITVSDVIWFIDNSAGGGGTGHLSNPFNSIAAFNATTADDPGDVIFIYTGNSNYTNGITLQNSQILVGQGATTPLATIAGITVPTHSNALPSTSGTRPVITNNSGNGVSLASNNLIRGLNIGNTSTSSGAGISGISAGNLTVQEVAISGQGKAVDINGGTLSLAFDSITVSSTTNGGFSLQNTSGTTTIGGLNITTTGGTGFLANNAGTINVTGATNSVSSTSGTAVNLTNTTIGASGITLQSVSSSGADTGITLNNTGTGDFTVTGTGTTDSSGGTLQTLNDHGIELINAQDVSISNMDLTNATTTQDVAVNTPTCDDESGGTNTGCNAPVQMVNATNISLTNLTINGSVQHGINGNNVNGLSISNTDVSNIGDDQLENGMHIINLLGTVSFNNLNIDGSETRNVLIENNTGTANITVTNSTFNNTTPANGEDGFHLIAGNSANVTLNVSDSSFIHNRGPQLKAHAEDGSTVNATITDNTFDGQPAIGGNTGVDLAVRDNANLIFNVSGTNLGDQIFQPIRGQVINIFAIGSGTASGRINRNDINGSDQASGVRVVSEVTTSGNPSVVVEIDGNDIDGVSGTGNAGINIISRDGAGGATGTADVQATINNNDVTITGADSIIQAYLNDGNTMCLDVTNNSAAGAATSPFAGFGSTHYLGNPVPGGGSGPGTMTYDGYIAGNLGGTWNANGNSPTLAAGIVGEAFVDGTQPTNGTCTTVASLDNPTTIVDAPNNNATVWAFIDSRDDYRATYLHTPALVTQADNEEIVFANNDALTVMTDTKSAAIAKPAQSGETINLALGLLDPGQVIAITFDVTVDSPLPTNVNSICNQGLFTASNHANLLTDDPTVGGASDPTCTLVEQPPAGTITIIKDTVPDAAQDFSFTTTGGLTPATFDLDDDTDSTLSNTQSFTNVTPGAYTVTETAVSGYTTTLSCVDPDGETTTAGSTANIDLDAGETITCTYTNTAQPGTIVIVKDTVPDAPQDFSFTTTGGLTPTAFDLDDDADGTLSNTQTFNSVAAGSYSVTETAVAGYTTTVSCVDPSGGTSTAGSTANINLAPGETVTCTFTNTAQPGTIVIIKDTVPDAAQDFSFTTTGGLSPATFDLDDDADGTLSNTQTFNDVAAGAYTVTEGAVSGYTTTVSCVDPSGGTSTAGSTTNINLAPGETVTCTYTNTAQPGTIVIIKDTVPDAAQDFSFTTTGGLSPATFDLDDDADGTLSNTQTFNGVAAGAYTVTEGAVSGYTTTVSCVDPSGGTSTAGSTANIDLAPGETVTCTFTNAIQTGTLTVIKDVVNDNGGTAVPSNFTMNVTGNNPSQASFPGSDSGVTITLEAGPYSVSETGPAGYAATFSADCVGAIAAGENKTCTVTNDDIQPTITVNKVLLPASNGGTFDLLIDNVVYGSGGDGATTGAIAFNPGSYTISEQGANGTNLAHYISVIGGDCAPDGTVTINIGDNAVCTITNTSRLIYVSVQTHGQAGNHHYVGDEDIISYEQSTGLWDMVFNGDEVDVDHSDVDAFHILPDGSILISFNTPKWVVGLGHFDDSDIVRFIPTQLGLKTAGTWEMFFDGSDVGLTKGAEDVDAIGFAPDGRLVISTNGNFSVPGLTGGGHDLIVFNDTTFGSTTSGTFAMYFDGSDVGLTRGSENIWGVWIDPDTNDIFLTTKGNFSVAGLNGKGDDIFICTPGSLGVNTSCTFSFFWDGTGAGLHRKLKLDGLHIQ